MKNSVTRPLSYNYDATLCQFSASERKRKAPLIEVYANDVYLHPHCYILNSRILIYFMRQAEHAINVFINSKYTRRLGHCVPRCITPICAAACNIGHHLLVQVNHVTIRNTYCNNTYHVTRPLDHLACLDHFVKFYCSVHRMCLEILCREQRRV